MGKARLFPVYVSDCQLTGLLRVKAATLPGVCRYGWDLAEALPNVAADIMTNLGFGAQPEPAKPMAEGEWLRWVQVEEPQAQATGVSIEGRKDGTAAIGEAGKGVTFQGSPWRDFVPGKMQILPVGTLAATDSAVLCSLAERLAAVEARLDAIEKAGATAFPHLEAAMRAGRLILSLEPLDEGDWRASLEEAATGVLARLGGTLMRRCATTATGAIVRLEQVAEAAAKEVAAP